MIKKAVETSNNEGATSGRRANHSKKSTSLTASKQGSSVNKSNQRKVKR